MVSIPAQQLPLFSLNTKACRVCHTLLPIDQFSFKVRATARRDTRCKACVNALCAARYAAHPERQHAASAAWRAAYPDRIKAANAAWHKANRERHSATTAAWYAANRERKRETNAAWIAANKERQKANIVAWHAANRERWQAASVAWRAANRERQKVNARRWRKANPGRVAAFDLRRRHRVAVAGDRYTGPEWEDLKARYDYRCLKCRRQEPDIKLTFDHVVPVSKGGTNDIANGQPLCLSCNSRKHTQVLDLR